MAIAGAAGLLPWADAATARRSKLGLGRIKGNQGVAGRYGSNTVPTMSLIQVCCLCVTLTFGSYRLLGKAPMYAAARLATDSAHPAAAAAVTNVSCCTILRVRN
jgi:hypothetical protein